MQINLPQSRNRHKVRKNPKALNMLANEMANNAEKQSCIQLAI